MRRAIGLISPINTVRALQLFQVMRFCGILFGGILLSRSPLSMREIGIFESILFISGAFSFFWVGGLMNGLSILHREQENPEKSSFFFNAAVVLYILNALLLIVMLLFQRFVETLLPPEAVDYFQLLLLFIFLNNPAFLIEQMMMLQQRPRGLLIYGWVQMCGYILCTALPVFMGYGLNYSLYALIVFALLKNFYLLSEVRKSSRIAIDLNFISTLLIYTAPLIVSMLISGSAEYIDGFLVSTHFGSDAFAIFRYGAKELPLAVLLSGALSNAMTASFSSKGLNQDTLGELKKESLRLMHLLFPVTIVLLLSSTWFYPLVFRSEFVASAPIFNTYLLLLISRAVFPQTLVMALGKTGVIFKIALLEISVNTVCSYFLMLQLGIIGIALGTLVAFFTEKLALAVYLHKIQGIAAYEYIPWKTWLMYGFLLLSVYFVHYFSAHI